MKKTLRTIIAVLLLLAVLFTVSCGKKEEDPYKDMDPADLAEAAMSNFVKKLQTGNYTCGTQEVLVTTAYSPEQVYFSYPHVGYPTVYAYMTLKGETFATMIENNVRYEINFVSNDNAIDAVGQVLPNYWYNVTNGNMFELFYNDPQDPMHFTSNDEIVKYTVGALGGYGQPALELMQEVNMTFDAPDPTTVRFTAVVDEQGMYHYSDLDVTLTFGNATAEPHIQSWLKDPEYPAIRTEWTKEDEQAMDAVFMRGFGKDAVPFPKFASYALIFDQKAYDEFGGMRVTDSHATEQDVEDYKALLLQNGYKEAQEKQDDGSTVTVYRKLLREKYNAYAELYPSFDGGFEMIGVPYYEDPHYEGLAAMSAAVQDRGFPEFLDTDIFEGWSARDEALSRSESLAYFFDYEIYMPFILTFSDADAAQAYWEEYEDRILASGFQEVYSSEENRRDFRSADESRIFKCTMYDESVRLDFKSERLLSEADMESMLSQFDIPSPGFSSSVGGRNQAKYRYEITGFTGLFFTVTKNFANSIEAEAFLDGYTAVLDDRGYMMTDPEKVGSRRQFLFLNDEEWKYVGFDYFPGDEAASVLLEFFAGGAEEGEDEVTLMSSELGLRN